MTNKTSRWLLCLVLAFALTAAFALAACEQQATATFTGGSGATGEPPAAITGKVGDEITLPDNTFSYTDRTFAGWSDGTRTYDAGSKYTLAGDVTFTAQWTTNAQQATATFTGGSGATGDAPAAITGTVGGEITLPDNTFSYADHTFAGWSDGTDTYGAGSKYTLAGDVTFTAQWTANGTPQPTEPFVTGYFNGYIEMADADGSHVLGLMFTDFGSSATAKVLGDFEMVEPHAYTIADNKITFAYGDVNIELTIDGKNVSGSFVADLNGDEITLSVDADMCVLTLQGSVSGDVWCNVGSNPINMIVYQEGADANAYTYTVSDETVDAASWTMPAQNCTMTVTAQHTQQQVTVTFKVGGDVFTTQTIDSGSTATKPDPDPTDPNCTKTFRYWTDDEGTEFLFTTPVTADITLNAKFAICVTFALDGGTGTQPQPVWEESYSPMGISVQLPAAAGYSKGDLVLVGWSDGSHTYQPGTTQTFTSSATLTAVWDEAQTEPTKYNVSYYEGYNAEVSGQAPQGGEYAVGVEITFPACTWTRTGYTFAGWKVQHWVEDSRYEEEGGSWVNITETVYQPQQTYQMPAEDIQILATWTAVDVTLKFDPNGGTGEMAAKTFKYATGIYSQINGLQCTFSNAGKQFVGWAYTAQGPALSTDSSTPRSFDQYKQYVQESEGSYSLTLYAIWTEAPAPSVDFAELCGVWTNGEKSIILSQAGEDSYEDIVGSAIVDGNMYYSLIQGNNQLGDSDTYGEDFLITIDSATSITCKGTTYTEKTPLENISVADLAGSWNASTGTSKLTFTSAGKATYTLNGADNAATLLCIDKYAVVICSSQKTIFILSLNQAKDKLTGSSRYNGGNTVSREYSKDTTPPVEEKTLKYVGEVQTTYGNMTVVFKSIEMIEGDDNYAKLTYTVDGTEHVDELKNDETNKTFMKQVTTGSWPGSQTVIKFWKMFPLANPPYTRNSSVSYPGTSYSVGLTGDGTKLAIATSTSGDIGALTLEGSEELPPEELPIFTGTATYTNKGFGNATFTVTQIEIDTTVLTTKAYITYSTTAQASKRVVVTLSDNSQNKSKYEGDGDPKFYYEMKLASEGGQTAFYIAVIDDNTVVLCDSDDASLGTFTKGGSVVTPTQQYDVTYSAGDHTAGVELPQTQQYEQGAQVTVEFGLGNVTEGDAHYMFTGWSDGKGHVYQPGEQFDMPAEGVTLTAQWESYTPTTKTLNDYLGIWEGESLSDNEIVKITINSDGISFGTKDYPDEPTALANVTEIKDGKYLVVTAQRIRQLGPNQTVVFTLVITFTEDNKATMAIDGATSEFTRTSTIQPSEPDEKPEKPEDADGKYTNAAGTTDLDDKFGGYGEYNFTEAELTGNKLHLVSSYPIDVDLTWNGNEATGTWKMPLYKLTVVATEGQLEITFNYGSDYTAVFTKQTSGGGDEGGKDNVFTGNLSFQTGLVSKKTVVITEITIDISTTATEAKIVGTYNGSAFEGTVRLTAHGAGYYSGDGTATEYYTFTLPSDAGSLQMGLVVFDDGTIALCNFDTDTPYENGEFVD